MATRRINGTLLEQMLRNGLAYLSQKEDEINHLNVFPVADGDTGTNMRLTLENGIRTSKSSTEVYAYLRDLSEGMLLGARGNSGVILSQFFKGFYLELSRTPLIGPGELRSGLIRAYKTAYKSVVQPVEGTILSVTREGIEHIRTQIDRNTTMETFLSMYVAEMNKTLALTPEMLPVLKEAGVVDSGALGFIVIVEGMLKYLNGEVLEQVTVTYETRPVPKAADSKLFNENSAFEFGYCTEFILQLMNDPKYNQRFRVSSFIEDLKILGSSLVVVQDGKRVKVHIHTFKPAKVISLAQEYGEFLTFKLENMQVQHNEQGMNVRSAENAKPLATIAVVNGEGVKEIFSQLGCDCIIDGGRTMNTSSKEFVDAISSLNAKKIIILPNNPNVIKAAGQAVELLRAPNVEVIPTVSIAEGYYALAMDIPDSGDVEYRVSQMKAGVDSVVTLSEATASRGYTYHEISCKKGDEILLVNNELTCVGGDLFEVAVEGVKSVDGMSDKENCVVFKGKGVSDDFDDRFTEALVALYPMLEVTVLDGGQDVYHLVIGIS